MRRTTPAWSFATILMLVLWTGAAQAQQETESETAGQEPRQQETNVAEETGEEPSESEGPDSGEVQLPEVTVPGQRQEGYRAGEATTATKTATPVMETPRSVQSVTREVIDDQQALSLEDALKNVSGTVFIDGGEGLQVFSRGYEASVYEDGFPLTEFTDGDVRRSDLDLYDVERVEVLKGASSMLYGRGNPGGTINIITKKPEAKPSYTIGTRFGSFQRVRPHFDFTGPLNGEGTVRYRLLGLFESANSFRDEVESEQVGFRPSMAFDLTDDTTLLVEGEYFDIERTPDGGVPSQNGEIYPGVPNYRFLGEPTDEQTDERVKARATLLHDFNSIWRWKTAVQGAWSDTNTLFTRPDGLEADGRTATRSFIISEFGIDDYRLQTQLTGEFATGWVDHRMLLGVEAGYRETYSLFASAPADNIDIYNPDYGPGGPQGPRNFTFISEGERDLAGVFAQDQLSFSEEWHLMLGGRYDYLSQTVNSGLAGGQSEQPRKTDHAFSPNAGLVYRPIEPLSFYGTWSQSFQQQNGIPVNIDGEVLEPEESTLYETGVKWSLFEERLGGTLALYRIDKENARSNDQDNPGFQKAFGEVRSQGIEVDISGQITPGWRVITAYAYNDSEITRQTDPAVVGNRPKEIPRHSARLWSTYRFQARALRGFGFGGGLSYVGEREANDANTYELPGYTTVDAAVFYQVSNLKARLNFRNLLDNDDIVLNAARGTFVRPGAPFSVLASLEITF